MKISIFLLLLTTLTTLGYDRMKYKYLDANLKFSMHTFATFSKVLRSNFVISPVSLHLSMFWLLFGANAHTGDEIQDMMRIEHGVNLNLLYKYFLDILEKQNSTIHVFNRIFVDTEKFDIIKNYTTKINQTLHIDLYDFKEYSKVPSEIYDWLDHMENPFKQKAGLTILNTVYFIGEWNNTFVRVPGIFHTADHKSKTVDMLVTAGTFRYYRHKFYTFLELPFVNSEIVLVLVEADKFYKFDNPSIYSLEDIFSITKEEWRDVYLRFPANLANGQPIVFKEFDQQLGLSYSFSENATFRNLTPSSVNIDSIVQNTYISMDRAGVSFSSASTSMIEKAKRNVPEISFQADSQFIYFFKHKELGILFVGRYVGP